jgi:hypothetical protein
MGVVLDLIASMAVRGAIIYIVLTMNISLHELLYEKAQYAIVKQNTATVADILRNDLRYIGYNLSSGNAFLTADTSQVKFVGDTDNNGTVDTVYFYLGAVSEMSGTANPNDRIIYRQTNSGTPVECGHGVTQLSLKYYNSVGNETSTLSAIRSLSIKLVVEGDVLVNNYYPTSIWETYYFPTNI